MKKKSLWAGIIGGLLVVGNGYGLAQAINNPTSLFRVNVAIISTGIAWIALGVFLIILFIKLRHKEDLETDLPKPASNTPEDIERLGRQRNWIFAFVLSVQLIGLLEIGLLNDYTAGLALINIAVIFAVLMNIIFLYIAIQLFRNKRDVLGLLFYAVILSTFGATVIDILMEYWFSAAATAFFGFYFIYAIKAPLNRKNHRIAHLIILPAVIVISVIGILFDTDNISELNDKELFAEQQFANEAANLNSAYLIFLQREAPGKKEIADVRNGIMKREAKIVEIVLLVGQLQEELKKQLPTVAQQKTLERLRYYLLIMDTHRAQANKLEELMAYAEKINFAALTDKQIADIRKLTDEIEAFSSKFTEIEFEQSNANIN